MRREKLNTVFNENVNPRAESILEMVKENITEHGHSMSVTRSTILRIAMNYGLNSLYNEIGAIDSKGESVKGKIRCEELRAIIGADSKKASY